MISQRSRAAIILLLAWTIALTACSVQDPSPTPTPPSPTTGTTPLFRPSPVSDLDPLFGTGDERLRVGRSVVQIHEETCDLGDCKTGTGVIIHKSGLVLTAWHVVERSRYDTFSAALMFNDKDGFQKPPDMCFHAHVIAYKPEDDLALLKIEPRDDARPHCKQYSVLNIDRSFRPGGKAPIIGFPTKWGTTISTGEIDLLGYDDKDPTLLKMSSSAAAEKGISGGPVLVNNGGWKMGAILLSKRDVAGNQWSFARTVDALGDFAWMYNDVGTQITLATDPEIRYLGRDENQAKIEVSLSGTAIDLVGHLLSIRMEVIGRNGSSIEGTYNPEEGEEEEETGGSDGYSFFVTSFVADFEIPADFEVPYFRNPNNLRIRLTLYSANTREKLWQSDPLLLFPEEYVKQVIGLSETPTPIPCEPTTSGIITEPMIKTSDYQLTNGYYIIVDMVDVSVPSWLIAYSDSGGAPNAPFATQKLDPGRHCQVDLYILGDEIPDNTRVWIELRQDVGDDGFQPDLDVPLFDQNNQRIRHSSIIRRR